MEQLFEKFLRKISGISTNFVRDFIRKVDWQDRMIGIRGARGVGKTTLLLQYARLELPLGNRTLYVSLDDIYFANNTLLELADQFVKNGGEFLILDEVHRYATWSVELKNIYDDYPVLKVIFTGSSALHLHRAKADLSRRVVIYHMPGLSLREFLRLDASYGISLPPVSLSDIIENHTDICLSLTHQFKPLPVFREYLSLGYYPFFTENKNTYHIKLAEILNLILEVDLPHVVNINLSSIEKIRKLLYLLVEFSPFKPNIQKLSERVGVARNTVIAYLQYLQEKEIISLLYSATKSISAMQKPEKVYLQNPNLFHALASNNVNVGSLRETFFLNQLQQKHTVQYPKQGGFLIDDYWVAEIGGSGKGKQQLKGIENGFIAADHLEIGYQNKIPLWLFGFLY
ncbi:ATP-binding protein [Tunicatimonas pelagia]|uniref:ATP-binding protein n=1 Tax=Tunicatimonas pelagia TaxID=931531 RepID=UPI00266655A2|nr:AAA family ATPase [Tunicatimonas pelagia]WKN46013.1 AAA family ATPase [Tunicatimonas pelagia]